METLKNPETRVFRAADGEDVVILSCVVLIRSQGVTNRQTDRQTDTFAIA